MLASTGSGNNAGFDRLSQHVSRSTDILVAIRQGATAYVAGNTAKAVVMAVRMCGRYPALLMRYVGQRHCSKNNIARTAHGHDHGQAASGNIRFNHPNTRRLRCI